MGLTITSTPARLYIERIPEKLNIQTNAAKLELTQKHAKVNIETEQIRVKINQYPCFAEEGLKNSLDLAKELTEIANASVREYIAKKTQNGDDMKKIGNKANIMLDNIARDSVTKHEFGMVTMPTSRPIISFEGGSVQILAEFRNNKGEMNGVTGTYTPGSVNIDYTPAKINIQMKSYGALDIKYVGSFIDATV